MRGLTVVAITLLCGFVRSETAKSQDASAGQPNMEVPLRTPELLQSAANSNGKNLRSAGYPLQQQSYGGSDYGGSGYDSSPQNYGFDCYGKQPALYGDSNYDCRIFHVCQADGRQDTLRCPPKTRFNNYLGVCDWEDKIDRTCMPLYKEEYGSNYGSQGYEQGSYGGQQGMNYGRGNQYKRRR